MLDQLSFNFNLLVSERIDVGLKGLIAGKSDSDLMCSRRN